jgi:RNA polymerase sigma-70 factor (ECF subfamily)
VQRAPRRVLRTADHVGRFMLGTATRTPPAMEIRLREVNGAPAAVVTSYGRPHSVLQLAARDGLVTCVFLLTNPRKLTGIR